MRAPTHDCGRDERCLVLDAAVVAVALASSMFFKLEPGEARLSIIRYHILTMVPFAIVSPLIGPLIDRLRSGHRYVIIATAGGRAVLCAFMIGDIGGQNPFFFFEALGVLALQKAYQVARNALVPSLVPRDDLVGANALIGLNGNLARLVETHRAEHRVCRRGEDHRHARSGHHKPWHEHPVGHVADQHVLERVLLLTCELASQRGDDEVLLLRVDVAHGFLGE